MILIFTHTILKQEENDGNFSPDSDDADSDSVDSDFDATEESEPEETKATDLINKKSMIYFYIIILVSS
jgi:hypothetical protein